MRISTMILGLVSVWASAQSPQLTSSLPTASFAGEQVCVQVALSNQGSPGYAPYLRLILPEGLSMARVSFIDLTLTTQVVGSFSQENEGRLWDPLAETVVLGNDGDQLLLIEYPIGSVVSGGPPLAVELCLNIATDAAIGVPLPLSLQPVYRLGDAPTGTTPIEGSVLASTVTPTLLKLKKSYLAPEKERPPQNSFPFDVKLTVDVANGKTVHNLRLEDGVPATFLYAGVVSLPAGCTVLQEPVTKAQDQNIVLQCDALQGVAGDAELTFVYRAHVRDILEESQCQTAILGTPAYLDGEHPLGVALPRVSDDDHLTAKHVALQKSASVAQVVPGQTFQYALDLQVTDFAAVTDLHLQDQLPDGVTYLEPAQLTVNGAVYDIGADVVDQGEVNLTFPIHGVTGDLPAGSVGRLVYSVGVDQDYVPEPDPLLAADPLNSSVNATYALLEGAANCQEGSGATVRVKPVRIEKTIVNGKAEYQPGDLVTFRLEMDIPSGDTEAVVLNDFLPLPVFEIANWSPVWGSNIRPANGHSLSDTPAIVTAVAQNQVQLRWPAVHGAGPQKIAVEMDIPITDTPFRDDLYLTNLLQASSDNSFETAFYDVQGVSLRVRAPKLSLIKGVTGSDNPASVLVNGGLVPANGNIQDIDAGDRVFFSVTVLNQGGAPAYDVVVRDLLGTYLESPALISVEDGGGQSIPVTGDLFVDGLQLGRVISSSGAGGADRAVITYSAVVSSEVLPELLFTNTATATWGSLPAAPPFPLVEDTATLTSAGLGIAKQVHQMSPNPAGDGVSVAGDLVTYQVDVTLMEGTNRELLLVDQLPAGYGFVAGTLEVLDPHGLGVSVNPTVTGSVAGGQEVSLEVLGDTVLVPGNNIASDNGFGVRYAVRVWGSSAANQGVPVMQQKRNLVTATHRGQGAVSDHADLDFAEPILTLSQSMTPETGFDSRDGVTLTFVVRNTGTADAYDLDLSTTLNQNGNLFNLESIVENETPLGFLYSYSNGELTYSGDHLAVGQELRFSVTGVTSDTIQSGGVYTNTATVRGDSQRGVVEGERSTRAEDTLTARANEPVVGKQLLDSDQDFTAGTHAAVGELLTFEVIYTFPEGRTLAASEGLLIDTLPRDLAYQSGSARLHVAADTPMESSGEGILPTTPTAFEPLWQNNVLIFDLGNITNNDSDPDSERIILTYDALVLNSNKNNRRQIKTNRAAVNYLNRDGNGQSQSSEVSVTIVEPSLHLTQSMTPSAVMGGSEVTVTIRLKNRNQAATTWVWEPVITNSLPDRLLQPRITQVRTNRNLNVAGCADFVGNQLTWALDTCVDGSLAYLRPGDWMEVVYTATVDPLVRFEEVITNVARASGSSLQGSGADGGTSTGERTGSGQSNELGQAVNDLSVSRSRGLIANRPNLSKSPEVLLPIGAQTVIRTTIDVPVGTTEAFVLTESIPVGLRYTGAPLTLDVSSNDLVFSNMPVLTFPQGSTTMVLDFGDMLNQSDAVETLVLTFPVEVANVFSNQRGVNLDQAATLDYQGVTQPKPSAQSQIHVIEANLDISHQITEGAAGSDGGDPISFRMTLTNTDPHATAHQVVLSEQMNAYLSGFQNLQLAFSNQPDALSAADAVISDGSFPAQNLSFPPFDLLPGGQLVMTWTATVTDDAVSGTQTGAAATAHYQSLPSGGRMAASALVDDDDDGDLNNYRESDQADLVLDASLHLQNQLAAVHVTDRMPIGRQIFFDLTLDLVEGVTDQVSLQGTLPVGLAFEQVMAVEAQPHFSYTGSAVGSVRNGVLTIPLGQVTNLPDNQASNDHMLVRIATRLQDIAVNQADRMIPLVMEARSLAGNSLPATEDIVVVEPNLAIQKQASTALPSLGDSFRYTITVRHDQSGADAHEIVLRDPLPTGLSLVPDSVTGPVTLDGSNPSEPVFALGSLGLDEREKQFSFAVTLSENAATNQEIENRILADYRSLAGAHPEIRVYQSEGTDRVLPSIPAFIDAVKTVVISLDQNQDGRANPGDQLTYTITLENQGGLTCDVRFYDPLPSEIAYVAGSLTSDLGIIDDGDPTNLIVAIPCMEAGVSASIQFNAVVGDAPEGTVILNQGLVDSARTVPEPTDLDGNDANGDQPTPTTLAGPPSGIEAVYLHKLVQLVVDADQNGAISPGDTMQYDMVLNNRVDRTHNDVRVTDLIPAGLTYVPGSAWHSEGSLDINGDALIWTLQSLSLKGFADISFRVTIDTPLYDRDNNPNTELFSNQALVQIADELDIRSDANGDPSDGYQATRFVAVANAGSPRLDLEKRWELAVDVNGNGTVDVGDTLAYHLSLSNVGAGPAENVRITDDIPSMTLMIAGSLVVDQGSVVTENPVALNLGEIPAGGMAGASFRVEVGGDAAGQVIANQASAIAHNTAAVPSDDNSRDDDGLNPTLTPVNAGGDSTGLSSLTYQFTDSTFTGTSGTNLHIGERFQMTAAFHVPAGTSNEVLLRADLLEGLTFVPGSARLIANYDIGMTLSQNPGNINREGSGTEVVLPDGAITVADGALRLFLGDVINSDDDANSESIIFSFWARPTNDVINQEGRTLPQAIRLDWRDGLNGARSLSTSAEAVTLQEPTCELNMTASPTTLLSVGGTVSTTLSATNTGQTPASNMALRMDLSAWENMTLGDLQSQNCSDALVVSNNPLLVTASCEPGGSFSIEIQSYVASPEGNLTLSPRLTWTSLPGASQHERTGDQSGANDYFKGASEEIAVANIHMHKTVENQELAVGETTPFTVVINIPPSTQLDDAVIREMPDPHLLYLPGSLNIALPPALEITSPISDFQQQGDVLLLPLGSLSNTSGSAQTLTVTYEMYPENHIDVQAATELTNRVALAFDNPSDSRRETISSDASIQVIEPYLEMTHRIIGPDDALGPGEATQVEVRVRNTGEATARDVILQCPNPGQVDAFSNVQLNGRNASIVESGNGWATTAFDLAKDEEVSVTYTVTIPTDTRQAFTVIWPVFAHYASLPGDSSRARTGEEGEQSEADVRNNYSLSQETQTLRVLSLMTAYSFEDLRNDSGRGNDFDYNDVVVAVDIQETLNPSGQWSNLTLTFEMLARGAAYHHDVLLDIGLAGSLDGTLRRYDPNGQLFAEEAVTHTGDYLSDVVIFSDTWAALPPWASAFANTQVHQPVAERVLGARVVLDLIVNDPQQNPRVGDLRETVHLNELLNHLIGPRIYVRDTGQTIQARWRLASATQDLVSADIYGQDAALLGFPLDQALSFESDWLWPVEIMPVWDAYPGYVTHMFSGKTQARDWHKQPSLGMVWPVDVGRAQISIPERPARARGASLVHFQANFQSPLLPTPAVGDLDGDGDLEVVSAEYLNTLAIHDHRGALVTTINPDPDAVLQSPASPALVDLDGDGLPEILRGYDHGMLYAFDGQGNTLQTWTVNGTIKSSVAVGDITGDGHVNLVLLGGDAQLYAFHLDGSLVGGFPKRTGGVVDNANNFVILPSPGLTDFNGDGILEVIAVSNGGKVMLLDGLGNPLPNWPLDLNEAVLASPAVADLNNDGVPEVVVATDAGRVLCLSHQAHILWEARRVQGGPSSPVLGDLDGDGRLDVVTGSMDGRIYAWDAQGQPLPGWPVTTRSQIQASPALADLDGDGADDVVIGSFDTRLYAFKGDGSSLRTSSDDAFPVTLDAVMFSSPLIADLDGDGRLEILTGTHNRQLYAVKTPYSATDAAPWSQFRGDAQRTGAAGPGIGLSLQVAGGGGLGVAAPSLTASVNGRGPFTLTWWDEAGQLLAQDVFSYNPPQPTQSILFHVRVEDSSNPDLFDEKTVHILVSQNPVFRDLNGDGCNGLDDLWDAAATWGSNASPDANGDSQFNVLDLLYINTTNGCP